MAAVVSRSIVQAFFEAYSARDAAAVGMLLADDVEWTMAGPVDVFPFCGVRRGRDAVLDSIFRIKPGMLSVTRTEVDRILIDGESAGAFSRITAVHAKSGRTLSYHCAHFLVFRDSRLIAFEVVTDTFGIAEQVLGHRIDAFRTPEQHDNDDTLVML
ncbi:nuclear transport factor 2 family protein [Pseudorhodoplanes sp.]|uniref:nuclear transport factor 2 family protein n=1 Tax=Pseudorhodoplanes sp. TaxID=1934341 RepID=UPI003D10B3E1